MFAIAAALICAAYYFIGILYNTTALEVKRADSVTKSPVLSSFQECLYGQITVRAYGDAGRFLEEQLKRLETNM